MSFLYFQFGSKYSHLHVHVQNLRLHVCVWSAIWLVLSNLRIYIHMYVCDKKDHSEHQAHFTCVGCSLGMWLWGVLAYSLTHFSTCTYSLIPSLSRHRTWTLKLCGKESPVSFLTWAWCNRTERQRFTHCSPKYTFNTQYVEFHFLLAIYMTHYLACFESLWYVHTQYKISLTLDAAHVRKKYQVLPSCTTWMFALWCREPGKEATYGTCALVYL